MSFQDNLRAYRERLGINAKDFANSIGVKYSTYASYENLGREPKYATLIKIATALHVSVDDLLGYNFDQYGYWAKKAAQAGFKVRRYTDNDNKLEMVELIPSEEIKAAFKPGSKRPIRLTMDVASFIECSHRVTETLLDSEFYLMLYANRMILQALWGKFSWEHDNEEGDTHG